MKYPFLCEVKALEKLGRLISPPVITRNAIYIPIKLIPGELIEDFLESKGGDARKYLRLIYQSAMESLEQLHLSGISHGDSHPYNLLISESKNGDVNVVWLDFGWSRIMPGPGIP